MILDLHTHSDASEDSRAPVETYLKWLVRKRDVLPIDGIVLTEHRQWDATKDYRRLEDQYGILILRGAEVETDYGHVLVYGVNDDITRRFDFADVRLSARELIPAVAHMGGIAVPCHPGRPTIGLCEHYASKPPIDGVVAVEALNGGSRRGENERVQQLIDRYGYHAFGGSDSHLVSFIGICATEFDRDVHEVEALVQALRAGGYRPVDFRDRLKMSA
jgi:predicted metal-dependent phosphoesterase TrpH